MNNRGYKMVAMLLLLLLWACSSNADTVLRGKVVSISDGDTFRLLVRGRELRVRLSGIDCPERGQAFGTRAKQFSSQMIFGKQISVRSEGKDQYGRELGWVYLPNGRCLNHELLKAGLAWHYKKYNNDPALARMEQNARLGRLGLWVDRAPIPPWEFRRARRRS